MEIVCFKIGENRVSVNNKEIEVGSNSTAKFNAYGLITTVAQDAKTNKKLMVAYMNQEALKLTIETGLATLL